jgi:CubicO group peptidase (beta-lactamase class C family)
VIIKAPPQIVNTYCWDVSHKYGAGGLYSTAGDLNKWDQALNTDKLVSKDTLNTIFTSSVSANSLALPAGAVYDYGWVISKQAGYRLIEHGGEVNGFLTNLARYPDDQVTIIVLANWDALDPAAISRGLAALVFAGK